MTKIGKKLAAVFLAVVMVVTFMPMLGVQTVYAGSYTIHLESALHNSNWGVFTIKEQTTVWIDLDEVCDVSDDFMADYLDNSGVSVYYHDPISDERVKMPTDGDGKYSWTLPKGLAGKTTAFYFDFIGGNLYVSDTYTIKELPSKNAGSKTIDLTNGKVYLFEPQEGAHGSVSDIVDQTFSYANKIDGSFDEYTKKYEEGLEIYYADIDLNEDGMKDVRYTENAMMASDASIERLGTCSVYGTYTISLSPAARLQADLDSREYYSTLNLALGYIKVTAPEGKTLTYNGKLQTGVESGSKYTISNNSASNAGSYTAILSLKNKTKYTWTDDTTADKSVKWTINQAANPLTIKAKTATVKYSKLKKKTQTLAVTKVIKFTKKLNDKKTYKLVSAKKGSKSFKKYFKINTTNGKVTVKKSLKKGTYKVKVKVKAAGNTNYKASAVKIVTFTVKVK